LIQSLFSVYYDQFDGDTKVWLEKNTKIGDQWVGGYFSFYFIGWIWERLDRNISLDLNHLAAPMV